MTITELKDAVVSLGFPDVLFSDNPDGEVRCEFGFQLQGEELVPMKRVPFKTQYDMNVALESIGLGHADEKDNDGQLICYTGLVADDEGNLSWSS